MGLFVILAAATSRISFSTWVIAEGKPMVPAAIEKYLAQKFGENLEPIAAAMRGLARLGVMRDPENSGVYVGFLAGVLAANPAKADGIVARGHLVCAHHGWRFSTATGRHDSASDVCLVTYSVRVNGDAIEIDASPKTLRGF